MVLSATPTSPFRRITQAVHDVDPVSVRAHNAVLPSLAYIHAYAGALALHTHDCDGVYIRRRHTYHLSYSVEFAASSDRLQRAAI